jgi:Ca2+-binding RTX toxin-like protein
MAIVLVFSAAGADSRWLFPSAYAGFAAGAVVPQGRGVTVPIAASAGLGSEGFAALGLVLRFEGAGLAFAGSALTAGEVASAELRTAGGAALLRLEHALRALGFAAANDPALALAGADTLLGGAGNDGLFGFGGDDTLRGGPGDDTLDGGTGRDVALYGTATGGVDVDLGLGRATGGQGTDTLVSIEDAVGGPSDDVLRGDARSNRLEGGEGWDFLLAGGGDDTLLGGGGDDVLYGGAGSSTLDGGPGTDLLDYEHFGGRVTVDFGAGTATGQGLSDVFQGVEAVAGSRLGNLFLLGDNAAYPGAAQLRVSGERGNDRFALSAGFAKTAWPTTTADGAPNPEPKPEPVALLSGWVGSDTLDLSALPAALRADLDARVVLAAAAGSPTTWSELLVSFWDIENLVGSAQGDALGGDAAANTLWGGAGDDVLLGHGGDDRLLAGPGSNTLDGGSGFDIADHADVAGAIHMRFGFGFLFHPSGVDRLAGVEGLVSGSGDDELFGSAVAERFWGGAGGDWLRGLEGDDWLWGNEGNDLLEGGDGDDTLYGGPGGADTLDGGPGLDRLLVDDAGDTVAAPVGTDYAFVAADGWAAVAGLAATYLVQWATTLSGSAGDDTLAANVSWGSVLRGGGGRDQLWGRGFGDRLLGEADADTLRGAEGDDVLEGGAGDDQLVGGEGADVFVFAQGAWGYDQLFDFNPGAGDRLDFRGSGVASFDLFEVWSDGANTALIAPDGSRVDLCGVASVGASQTIF